MRPTTFRSSSMAKAAKKTAKKGKPGRKPVLTDELIQDICERLRAVFYLKHAIEGLGWSERSIHRWLQRGEEEVSRMEARNLSRSKRGEAMYVKLVREVRRTQADSITAHATNIQRAAQGREAEYQKDEKGIFVRDKSGNLVVLRPAIAPDWKASARYLEAVDYERWGRKVRTEVTTPEGGPTELRITVVEKRKTKKQLEEV